MDGRISQSIFLRKEIYHIVNCTVLYSVHIWIFNGACDSLALRRIVNIHSHCIMLWHFLRFDTELWIGILLYPVGNSINTYKVNPYRLYLLLCKYLLVYSKLDGRISVSLKSPPWGVCDLRLCTCHRKISMNSKPFKFHGIYIQHILIDNDLISISSGRAWISL